MLHQAHERPTPDSIKATATRPLRSSYLHTLHYKMFSRMLSQVLEAPSGVAPKLEYRPQSFHSRRPHKQDSPLTQKWHPVGFRLIAILKSPLVLLITLEYEALASLILAACVAVVAEAPRVEVASINPDIDTARMTLLILKFI